MDGMSEQEALDARSLEAAINVSQIFGPVWEQVLALAGDVGAPAPKAAARRKDHKFEDARDVKEQLEELEFCAFWKSQRSRASVTHDVLNALYFDLAVPRDRVSAKCDKGWVTLSGEVDRPYQKTCAEADVLRVSGVAGVTNNISVCPQA